MDKDTRNTLAKVTQACRLLLEDEFGEQSEATFDIFRDGRIKETPGAPLTPEQMLVREKLIAAIEHRQSKGESKEESVQNFLRECAFTFLNRIAALKMMESRGIAQECVSKGDESTGFKEFCGLAPGLVTLPDRGYQLYLECLFDEISREVGALFNRSDPNSLLWPRRRVLDKLLETINDPGLANAWGEDEAIGWLYQYFNSSEERKQMRAESAAPRNSHELAVRNQFFTPRYVVEFLTDNALGRTWYEMTKGETKLRDECRYLIGRPSEIFLSEGELPPEAEREAKNQELSQEEVFKQPVHILHRPLKDPRTILMLDPACGSMHFGLYAFDLFEVIYEEAWELEEKHGKGSLLRPLGMKALHDTYADKNTFLKDVPRLIVERNIHGIDIDPRCVQVAGLSLWLRAQKAWKKLGLAAGERPAIKRSNIVCAEPMPGEKELLREFVEREFPENERSAFLRLLETIIDKMELAGEAGSLLKIEEEIRDTISDAKLKWKDGPKLKQVGLFDEPPPEKQRELKMDLTGVSDEQFWVTAEKRMYSALRDFAEQTENRDSYQRRLFADDAARGFAFIDLCRQRYDVALMNPPFGDASLPSKPYIDDTYGDTKGDVYKAFVECFQARLVPAGFLGIISSRTGFFLGQSEDWRTRVVLRLFRPIALADLGMGVLDAMVEVAAYVLRSLSESETRDLTHSIVPVMEKVALDKQERFSLPKWQAARDGLKRHQAVAELEHLDAEGFVERDSGSSVRYTPLWAAVRKITPPTEPTYPPFVCLRALKEEEKGEALIQALAPARIHPLDRFKVSQFTGSENTTLRSESPSRFDVNPTIFSNLPGSPLSYWVPASVVALFGHDEKFESAVRSIRTTNPFGDNSRFVRLRVEVPCSSGWRSWTKGSTQRYFSDIDHVVAWDSLRKTYKGFLGTSHRSMERPASVNLFDQPGITWPLRARALSPSSLPQDCIFSARSFMFSAPPEDLRWLLALMSSRIIDYLAKVLLGRWEFPEFIVTVIQQIPFPKSVSDEAVVRLTEAATQAWLRQHSVAMCREISHVFTLPALLRSESGTLRERITRWQHLVQAVDADLLKIQSEIDEECFSLYGLGEADRRMIGEGFVESTTTDLSNPKSNVDDTDECEEESIAVDAPALVSDLLAHTVGCALGRWDLRIANGNCSEPNPPDPFDPVPLCPPGMLQNSEALPAEPTDLANYPLDIVWSGILVDDKGHTDDIEDRVRAVLSHCFPDSEEDIAHEACELLGVKSLREWFHTFTNSQPKGFFEFHLGRYTKGARKAPIYWPLSTGSGSYALWLYYPRLTPDTLFTALRDVVQPRLKEEKLFHDRIRQETSENPSRENRDKLGESEALLATLTSLETELKRTAPLFKPDLNDGVIINSAPLWRMIPHKKWQKDCKACWDKLVKGDYDWAHLAMHLWPERVIPKCQHDRSLAIAHGLEELFWEVDEKGKFKPNAVKEAEVERLIAERSSPAVKTALDDLITAPLPATGKRKKKS